MSRALFATTCAAMFVFGIVLGLPGAVLGLPAVAERLGLSLTIRGTLISSLFVGLFVGSVVSGPIVDRVGHRRALAMSSALVAMCLVAFGFAHSSLVAAVALVALGVASAGINTAANALVSEWFPESRARRMTTISIAVGIGGLLLSVAAALAAAAVSWQTIVFGAAVLGLIVAGVAGVLPSPASAAPHHEKPMSLLPEGLRQRHFAILAILLMLSSANESSMAGWTSTLLTARGLSPIAATWGLALHWAGLIAGRLLFGSRVERAKREAVAAAATAAVATLTMLLFVQSSTALLLLPAAVGVAISIVTPTLLALGGDRYPQFGGTVFGVLLTAAQVGAVIVPAAIGVIADYKSVREAMSLLILTSAFIVVLVRKE